MVFMAILRMFKDSALELKKLRCITVTAMLIALNLALKTATINITDDLKISFSFLALAAIGMLFGPTVSFLSGAVTDILGLLVANTIGAFNPLFTLVEAVGAMLYGLFLYRLKPIRFDKGLFKINNDKEQANADVVNRKQLFFIISGIGFVLSLILVGVIVFLIRTYQLEVNTFLILGAVAIVAICGCILYKFAPLGVKQLLRVTGAKFSVAVVCNIVMTPLVMLISGFWSAEVMWNVKIPLRLVENAIKVPLDCILLMIILFPIMVAYNRIFRNQSANGRDKK